MMKKGENNGKDVARCRTFLVLIFKNSLIDQRRLKAAKLTLIQVDLDKTNALTLNNYKTVQVMIHGQFIAEQIR